MVWLERSEWNRNLKPVEPGTKRGFASKFHNPGQPQIDLEFIDDERVRIFVRDIHIETEKGEQQLEMIVEKQSFSLKYEFLEGKKKAFYEAIYQEEVK